MAIFFLVKFDAHQRMRDFFFGRNQFLYSIVDNSTTNGKFENRATRDSRDFGSVSNDIHFIPTSVPVKWLFFF